MINKGCNDVKYLGEMEIFAQAYNILILSIYLFMIIVSLALSMWKLDLS